MPRNLYRTVAIGSGKCDASSRKANNKHLRLFDGRYEIRRPHNAGQTRRGIYKSETYIGM